MTASVLINRNVILDGHRTSMRQTPELWDALREICLREDLALHQLLAKIEPGTLPGARSSAVRDYVVRYFRSASTEQGHVLAGHRQVEDLGDNIEKRQERLGGSQDAIVPQASAAKPIASSA